MSSARVSGQVCKIPPALGTKQIAGFGGFRPLASLEKKITLTLSFLNFINKVVYFRVTTQSLKIE